MKLQQGRSSRGPLGKTTTGRADILQLNRHSDKKLLRLGNDDDDDEEALVSKRHSLSPGNSFSPHLNLSLTKTMVVSWYKFTHCNVMKSIIKDARNTWNSIGDDNIDLKAIIKKYVENKQRMRFILRRQTKVSRSTRRIHYIRQN